MTINFVTYCHSVCSKSIVHFINHGLDTLSNYEGCLIRPSDAKPRPHLTASYSCQLTGY